jgi:hypothetical protein
MGWRRAVLVSIGLVIGGWMTFDGVRALVVGDFVTPSSGDYAGQLGPWASLLSGLGVDPRSLGAKALHVAGGGLWLAAAVACLRSRRPPPRLLTAAALASLWYLPFGTLGGFVALVLVVTRGPATARDVRAPGGA